MRREGARSAYVCIALMLLLAVSASGQILGPYPVSTTVQFPIEFSGAYPNLAGFIVDIHVIDPSEVAFIGVTYNGGLGPLSTSNAFTSPATTGTWFGHTFWLSGAPTSFSGTLAGLFDFTFHATGSDNGTTTAVNPDFRTAVAAISHLDIAGSIPLLSGSSYFTTPGGTRNVVGATPVFVGNSDYRVVDIRPESEGYYDIRVSEVPEPASYMLMGIGLVGLGLAMRRRQARNSAKS